MRQNTHMNAKANKTISHAPDPSLATFLTSAELAERWKVTPMSLRRWRKAKKIRAYHIGRGIRFALEEVKKFEEDART